MKPTTEWVLFCLRFDVAKVPSWHIQAAQEWSARLISPAAFDSNRPIARRHFQPNLTYKPRPLTPLLSHSRRLDFCPMIGSKAIVLAPVILFASKQTSAFFTYHLGGLTPYPVRSALRYFPEDFS